MKKFLVCGFILLIFTLSLYSAAKPAKETLIYGVSGQLSSGWDPYVGENAIDLQMKPLIFETLWDREGKKKLATSWKWTSDTTLRVNLRRGVKFHDGSSMTAGDVKATFERASNPANQLTFGAYWVPVEVKIVNDYTVDIVSSKPFGPLEKAIGYCPILSSEDIAVAGKLEKEPNGTGYYRLKEYNKVAGKVTLEAYRSYWGGGPKIKTVVFQNIADEDARVSAFLTGEVDILWDFGFQHMGRLKEDASVKFIPITGSRLFWLKLKMDNEYLKDKKVRQAIARAIDVNPLIEMQGGTQFCRPADSVVLPSLPGYKPLKGFEHNPDAARKLLAESKYPTGVKLSFLVTSSFAIFKDLGLVVSQSLKEIGIDAPVTVAERGGYGRDYPAYDLAFVNSASNTGDPDSLLAYWVGELAKKIFKFPEPDQKLEGMFSQQRSLIGENRTKVLQQMYDYLWEEKYFIPLWTAGYTIAYRGLKNYTHGPWFAESIHDVDFEK
jgi:peptide/nickel transport system substrate-binding protein